MEIILDLDGKATGEGRGDPDQVFIFEDRFLNWQYPLPYPGNSGDRSEPGSINDKPD
jgi:hypothetical protein